MLHDLALMHTPIRCIAGLGTTFALFVSPCCAQVIEVAPYSLGLGQVSFDRDTIVNGSFLHGFPVLATLQDPYTIEGRAGERLVVFACSRGRSLWKDSDYSFLPMLFVISEDSIRGGRAGTKARVLPAKSQVFNGSARRIDVTLPTTGRYLVVVAINSFEYRVEREEANYALHLKRFALGDTIQEEDLKRFFFDKSLYCA